jgi:hypothetical protein
VHRAIDRRKGTSRAVASLATGRQIVFPRCDIYTFDNAIGKPREDLALSASAQCPGAARAPTPSVRSTSPAQLRFRAQKENPAAGDGRGFRTIGRPGIGGAWRPSKPISRPPPWPGSIRRCRVYGRRYNTLVQRPDVSFRQALNRFAILAKWSKRRAALPQR